MSMSKQSLQTGNFYVPRFEVEINGSKLPPDISTVIKDISVVEKIDEGATFTINMHDEFDLNKQEFNLLDKNEKLFEVGNMVKIKIGYESTLKDMVIGNITGLEPSFFSGETPALTVKGQDLSYDFMKRKTGAAPFQNKTYSDIAAEIAKKAGLSPDVDKTTEKVTMTKNSDESYFEFLNRLALRVGFQVGLDQKKLYFKKPADDKKEILTLVLGQDIISFQPKMDTTRLVSEVEVRGHDPDNPANAIVGRAKAGSERPQESGRQTASQLAKKKNKAPKKVITNMKVKSVSHANELAKAVLNKASDTYIGGDVVCIGIPDIRPGVCIKLEKMGKRFSGKYYVSAATHTISESGYKTRFTVKRNAA